MPLQTRLVERIAVCQTLAKYKDSTEQLAVKNALLQIDYKNLQSSEDFAQILLNHSTQQIIEYSAHVLLNMVRHPSISMISSCSTIIINFFILALNGDARIGSHAVATNGAT